MTVRRFFILLIALACSGVARSEPAAALEKVTKLPGLVALWTFQEKAGEKRIATGKGDFPLQEMAGAVERVDGGIFGPHAARLKYKQWFELPREKLGALDIHGKEAKVSIVAWVKRAKKGDGYCEAVAGVWDEQRGMRQYALFVAMPVKNAEGKMDQVGGHISSIGGSSKGKDHSVSRANGATPVPYDEWHTLGFTYDGEKIRAFFDGGFDELDGVNPYPYPHGIFDGGENGSSFTVGSVPRGRKPSGPGNFFAGTIGGIAVFDRPLTPEEMGVLAEIAVTR